MIIEIKVVPQSGRQGWVLDKSGQLKCYLKSAPEKGLANHELVTLLAKSLKLPQMSVLIVSGHTGRKKRVEVKTKLSYDQILAALGIEQQMKLG